MTIARDIAEYACSLDYSDLNGESIGNMKRLIVDTVGCGIGAFDQMPIRMAMKALKGSGRGNSTILGTGEKTNSWTAAFINGAMTRYFDYNDTYDAKEFSHPSDNIMPILAVAESEKRSGREALLGCLIAYELQARLADSANLWKKGWDHVIYGLVSVSAASSRMMGLSADTTEQAINIALNSHLVMRQLRAGELSMWKAFAFSNAARNAIFSAVLAKEGMTGPSPVFEGEMGFFNQVSGRFTLNASDFGGGKKAFRINKNLMKYYPAETRAQAAIFAALELRSRIGPIDGISKVEIGAGEATVKVIGSGKEKWNPQTKETADHSIPYIVAAALMDGKVDINTFKKRRFTDRKTISFMKKISVKEVQRYTALFNSGGTVNAAVVSILLKNGEKLSKEVIYPKGHWKNPMADEEIEDKFRRLAIGKLGNTGADAALKALWNFEEITSIDGLFKKLRLK